VFAVGLTAELEARTRAGVEVTRDPDDPDGWRVFWHDQPDEDTMRQVTAEAMAGLSSDFTLPITSYHQQPIDFDHLAEQAMTAADPGRRLSRADRRELKADAKRRLTSLAKQGGWPAVRSFLRTAGVSV